MRDLELTREEERGYSLVRISYLDYKAGGFSSNTTDKISEAIYHACLKYEGRWLFYTGTPVTQIGFHRHRFVSIPKPFVQVFRETVLSELSKLIKDLKITINETVGDLQIRVIFKKGMFDQTQAKIDLSISPWNFLDPGKTRHMKLPYSSPQKDFLKVLSKTNEASRKIRLEATALYEQGFHFSEIQLGAPEPELWDGYIPIRF